MLLGLALLPEPASYRSHNYWKDASQDESIDRHITRIDTACAAKKLGSIESFAKDFFIIDSLVDNSGVSKFLTLITIERGERFSIAPKIDLTNKEKASFLSLLSDLQKPCLKTACIEQLNLPVFTSIVTSCSTQIGQHRHIKYYFKWQIVDNLEKNPTLSLVALASALIFLFMSILYNKTVGRLVKWVRTGS